MNLSDLAALVTVRNHINDVINDKSVTNRDDFRPLNELRIKLDKKFVNKIKELDINNLFPVQNTIVIDNSKLDIHTSGYISTKIDPDIKYKTSQSPGVVVNQVTSSFDVMDGVDINSVEKISLPEEIKETSESVCVKNEGESEAELALIAERVKAQKELLKKQGRSNKRISKANKDDSAKQE